MIRPTKDPGVFQATLLDRLHSTDTHRVEFVIRVENTPTGLGWTYLNHRISERDTEGQLWGHAQYYSVPVSEPIRVLIVYGLQCELVEHIMRLHEIPSGISGVSGVSGVPNG